MTEKKQGARIYRTEQKRRNITIDDETREKAMRIGKGNFSEGARKAIDAYNEDVKK